MIEEKIGLEIITPLFMGGAETYVAELRVPSIKGVMRYFYRAALPESVEALRIKEANLFGGKVGDDAIRAKVDLLLKADNLEGPIKKAFKDEYELKWKFSAKKNSLAGNNAGIAYLFYSLLRRKDDKSANFFKEGGKFSIILSGNKEDVKKYLAALWISVYFGAFGKRARRGVGNVEFTEPPSIDVDGLEFLIKKDDAAGIAEWLSDNFAKARKILGYVPLKEKRSDIQERVGIQYPGFNGAEFVISKKDFGDWMSALNDIGIKYMNFRKQHNKDIFKLAAFGVPIICKGFKIELDNDTSRYGSPLIFKVIKSKEKYHWMVIRLNEGAAVRNKKVVKIADKKQAEKQYTPELLDKFLDEIESSDGSNKNLRFKIGG